MTDPVKKLLELAEARFRDLTDPEKELIRAAVSGDVAEPMGEDDEKPTVDAEVVAWLTADPTATEYVHRRGIQLRGAKIEDKIDLEHAILPHPLSLLKCELKEGLCLTHARTRSIDLTESQTGPIMAAGLNVKGDILLDSGFHASGEVFLQGAEISGVLSCQGATIENPNGAALTADRMIVRGSVFLRNGFEAKGEVRLLGADIGSNLECDGATFENPNRIALHADGVRVRGDVFLRNNFRAEGEVRLLGVDIGGDVSCVGGSFKNPDGVALGADRAHVHGGVFLRNGFRAEGVVRFSGAEVDGDLDCYGGSFINVGGDALTADEARIGGNVFLNFGFLGEGEVRLRGAEVGGGVLCAGGTFTNPGADAFDIDGAKVAGTLEFRSLSETPSGRVILRNAVVGHLADATEWWPDQDELLLEGFTYDHIAGIAPHTAKERLDWIGRQPPGNFSLQPYEQLAKVLRGMGLEEDARLVAIAKQRVLRARLPRWRKPWSTFLDASIGYGYRPWRAVLWLFYLWLIGVTYLHGIEVTTAMCATKASSYGGQACVAPSGYPELVPTIYLIDTLLPFLDLYQEVYWEPDANKPLGAILRMFQWVYIGLGWLFSILAAIGFSGILRKD